MIQVKNLTKLYGQQVLFSDANISFGEKEKIGLVGRNGTGKSTFLKILLGETAADEGEIEFLKQIKLKSLEQHLNFEKETLLSQVCTALPKPDLEEDLSWKAKSVLMGLGFTEDDFEKNPKQFSSGYQIRIRLAESLVAEPEYLLLDEPTNYLDIVSLRWLENFLKNWNKSFILVTHDRTFMEKVVTHTVAIHRGKMRKMKGGPKKLLDQIEKDEVVYENTRIKQEKKQNKTSEFIRNFRAGARSAGLVNSRKKMLEKIEVGERLEKLPPIKFSFPHIPARGDIYMTARNLCFGYEKDDLLIDKFSITVHSKDRIAIIGKNGKGKSTLLSILSKNIEPVSGHISKGDHIQIGYFGSESITALNPQKTILQEMLSVGNANQQQVRSLCASLLFSGDLVKKPISALSGGEKSRLCLGKLMLEKHHILALDEPTNHLDMESCMELLKALKNFEGPIVLVSHDEYFLEKLSSRLVVFDNDEVAVKERNYLDFLEKDGWSEEEKIEGKKKKSSDQKEIYLEKKSLQQKLRKLQNDQEKTEAEITEAEQKREKNANLLMKAAKKKDYEKLKQYGENDKTFSFEISNLFDQLERLMKEEGEVSEKLEGMG